MATGIAWAEVNFKRKPAPKAVDVGLQLTASGALSGLGNATVFITITATADPTAICTNNGGNEAPGQNPAEVDVTGAIAIPPGEIKNGNLTFSVTTDLPEQPTPAEAGCPSSQWTAAITDMSFTSLTLTVVQNGITVLTTELITFAPTEDGDIIPLN